MNKKNGLLNGKVAIVTGASRGLGAIIAEIFAAQEAMVVINYLKDKESALKALDSINSLNGKGIIVRADVRKRAQVNQMVERTLEEFGRIDVLVNNAHTSFTPREFTDLSWEDVEEQIEGTVRATFNCSQAVIAAMIKNGGGKIINIGSITANSSDLSFGYGFLARNTAKAALAGFSRSLADDLAPLGIRVNVVSPGWLVTDQSASYPDSVFAAAIERTPFGRLATLEEVANTVLFYASEMSNFVTGTNLFVCGGAVKN